MPSNSFRRDVGPPPLRYRTPSPPRFAFEPISPIAVNNSPFEELGAEGPSWNKSNYEFEKPQHAQSQSFEDVHTQTDGFQGAMDTFASIALATNPASATQPHPSLAHPPGGLVFTDEVHEAERPSKRARSEKIHSAEWVREGAIAGIRPATSYEQSPDTRTFEAELLLNFSHKARFANNHVFNNEVNLDIPQRVIETPLSAPHDSKPFPSNKSGQDSLGTDGASNATAEPLPNSAMGEKMSEDILGVLDATPQPTSPKQYDLSPTIRTDEHRRVETTDRPPMSQESGLGDMYHEPKNPTVELEVGTLDNERADDYVATATPNDLRDGAVEEADPTSSSSREKSSGLENDESQVQPQESTSNEVETSTVPLDDLSKQIPAVDSEDVTSVSQEEPIAILSDNGSSNGELKAGEAAASATCTACHFSRNSSSVDSENNSTSWISCDACKAWFHFACAGFKSEREVRSVDKYRCRKCKPEHGSTTYVRKSSRAHSAIDYAGLNQGVIKTSDERPEHHYIKPIKDGVITFLPESFPRMRPELVTADFFEKGNGMKEPVVIPASLNPRPRPTGSEDIDPTPSVVEEWLSRNAGLQRVPDEGQDSLDMVMPQNMTVRMVSELYGPEERVEVIDVKSQNGEGKKWNMRRWADYYESSENKAVRNVISLEVSQSKLGRLIRRPKVVRDLDLQDSVWPQELQQKGEYPRVQFYCLMSVADCFTDFHIDFGGSSVFYHILKGKKTFLFIPPKEKHLKKYEEWCKSPAQNWTFLADQTKECYRVDLAEGDTMLIPAGWIHAVWTPEDSLVIGGNFLTRMHYGMQFRIAQTEKATGVARKFRYPHFQKLHWYVALKYLHDDPLPGNVKELVQEGGVFHRERPTHHAFDAWGENSQAGFENYHSRYYAQAELEGLPDLTRYLLRTALIDLGSITEGISAETRNAVKRAIPRGYGEPLEVVKEFAMWCAWKRGNEPIPHWAYPDAILEGGASDSVGKLSAAASKKLDQDAALQAPRRQSARRQQQQERQRQQLSTEAAQRLSGDVGVSLEGTNQGTAKPAAELSTPATPVPAVLTTPSKRKSSELTSPCHDGSLLDVSKKRKKTSRSGPASNRKPACEVCRKRRRACKHRDEGNSSVSGIQALEAAANADFEGSGPQKSGVDGANTNDKQSSLVEGEQGLPARLNVGERALASGPITPKIEKQTNSGLPLGFDTSSANASHSRGRTKACNDCRKSKRRCIHDENGNEDPVKAREAAIPRPAATLKRRTLDSGMQDARLVKKLRTSSKSESSRITVASPRSSPRPEGDKQLSAPVANMTVRVLDSEDRQSSPSSLPVSSDEAKPLVDISNSSYQIQAEIAYAVDQQRSSPARGSKSTEANSSHQDLQRRWENTEDRVFLTSEISPPSGKAPLNIEIPFLEQGSSIEQPAASLVSPPASAHEDAEKSPAVSQRSNLTPCTTSSRHSSRHPKQVQRYTPESGPARRASTSSVGDVTAGKSDAVQIKLPNVRVEVEIPQGQRDVKVDVSPDIVADEESLKLIKELQAQEHGLRRRGRV